MIDCIDLSLLRPSPRFFRPWSVISSYLSASHHTRLTKLTYFSKSRLTNCKELSLLRLSLRVFRSSSPKSSLIFLLETYDFLFPLDIHNSSPDLPSIIPFLKRQTSTKSVDSFDDLNLTLCSKCSFYELSSLTSSHSLWPLPLLQAYLN